MVSKEQIKAALDAVTGKEGGSRMDEMKSGTLTKNAAGRTPGEANGDTEDEECCCVEWVIYVVFTNCLTINNCAHEDWIFCKVD
ncbi:MAG: hypothetical protein QMC81_05120 [Thermoanaerobacterales bacterium]|nr:hypothetical protein [Bacillota bacterium]MDI6906854.1 hypothetical protein [Thermoanaerobacterales bacterium]